MNSNSQAASRRPQWEGAPRFHELTALAGELSAERASGRLNAEEELIGGVLSGALGQAHPIVVPASQVGAVPDDLFSSVAEGLRYAASARLPFGVVVLDFSEAGGGSVPLPLPEAYLRPDLELPTIELRAAIAAEDSERNETVWIPVVGREGEPPELIGMAIVGRDTAPAEGVWRERVETTRGEETVLAFSPQALAEFGGRESDEPASAPAGLIPAPRHERTGAATEWQGDSYLTFLAASTAAAVTVALKALFLLDSVNVSLSEVTLSRQASRAAARRGAQIASVINIRQPRGGAARGNAGTRDFSHRFEVRGNFAHYGPDTQLHQRSSPDQIRACPRCGTCRRVWRPPHVKGPADMPLVPKTRRRAG